MNPAVVHLRWCGLILLWNEAILRKMHIICLAFQLVYDATELEIYAFDSFMEMCSILLAGKHLRIQSWQRCMGELEDHLFPRLKCIIVTLN